jgi:ribonuclease D
MRPLPVAAADAAPPLLIADTASLAAVCARLATHPFVTVDTEFMRETTYYPKLCLIQMASTDEVVLVDPQVEGLDLAPFFALMADPAVTKVFHAARQDIEIIWNKGRLIPAPLFDTQVAAMVCGFGEQVGYESLAASLAQAKIDKSSRFTDWSRRPLTDAQLAYAAADVTHLRVVYQKLLARLEKTGRAGWVAGEMAVLADPRTYETEPSQAWQRVKARLRKASERLALQELAAWREREAQTRDVPRGRILKDDALIELAMAQPLRPEDMARLRAVPNGFERSRSGADILAAVAAAKARDPAELPPLEADRPSGNGALVQLLKVLLQSVSEKNQVAPRLIASAEEIDRFAASPETDHPILLGWKREVFGELALKLVLGEVTLGLDKGRVVAVPRG